MNELASPDLPAWACYVLVLTVGMLVARSQVDQLLASHSDRWVFLGTWLLFAAHAAVPVLLFWFLDYASAIHDTSLFAALVVAFGYRQIFAGGVQGIQMPGATPKLWQPFEAWVRKVADRIATQQKAYRDRLNETLRSQLSVDPKRLDSLESLALVYTAAGDALAQRLAELRARVRPEVVPEPTFAQQQQRARANLLLEDLRASQPEQYAELLLAGGLFSRRTYALKFGGGWAKYLGRVFALLIVALLVSLLAVFHSQLPPRLTYHRWRFTKSNATSLDHHRSEQFLSSQLKASQQNPNPPPPGLVLDPLLRQLKFKDVSPEVAKDVVRFVVNHHSRAINPITIPALIEALRSENADIRNRINEGLLQLREQDFRATASPPDTLTRWKPSDGESPGRIEYFVDQWQQWWRRVATQV